MAGIINQSRGTPPASRDQLKDQALSAARALVKRNLEAGWFIGGTVYAAPLDPVSARPLTLAMLRRYASIHPLNMAEVAHWARNGLDEADQVLREIAAEHVDRGEALPRLLEGYVVELLHPGIGRRPGRDLSKSFPQDVCIAMLVLLLTELLPLRPTRYGRSSANPSACSLIAAVLSEAGIHRGGESAVQKIWTRYRDMVTSERQAMFGASAA
jgi:hypothetical protein